MFLLSWMVLLECHRLLHACGDVSPLDAMVSAIFKSAPRMWRCFYAKQGVQVQYVVCSTHVEMFLCFSISSWPSVSLLHACGDVSDAYTNAELAEMSAPRMWRCF